MAQSHGLNIWRLIMTKLGTVAFFGGIALMGVGAISAPLTYLNGKSNAFQAVKACSLGDGRHEHRLAVTYADGFTEEARALVSDDAGPLLIRDASPAFSFRNGITWQKPACIRIVAERAHVVEFLSPPYNPSHGPSVLVQEASPTGRSPFRKTYFEDDTWKWLKTNK